MTKAELISAIKANIGCDATTKCAEQALTAVLSAIKAGVNQDKKLQILGFGTFSVKNRAAREGRNPKTGEKMQIPASSTVGFKPSSTFLD